MRSAPGERSCAAIAGERDARTHRRGILDHAAALLYLMSTMPSEHSRSEAGWPRRLAATTTALAAVGAAAAVLAMFVPRWPFALLEHFAVQLVAGGAVVVAGAAALRLRGSFDLAAITTLIAALRIAPDLCAAPSPLPQDGVALRVLVLNVHTEATSFDDVRRLIADTSPDVIGLVEVDQRWLDALAPAVAGYAGRIESPRPDNFGVAMYARARFTADVARLGTRTPSIVASLTIDGASLDLVLIHPIPPMSAGALATQRAALDATAAHVGQLQHPVAVMGDFNATPWSAPFRRFVAQTGLCDSRAGKGIATSYPAASAVLRIPIDHMLVTCTVGVRDRRVERDVGSDHLPVVVDLVVPRARP